MKMPPITGAAIRFITSAPVPVDHMIGNQPEEHRGHRHELGPDAPGSPFYNCLTQARKIAKPALAPRLLVCEIKIKKHENTGLRVHAQQRHQSDPHANTKVVAQQVEQPDRAHG